MLLYSQKTAEVHRHVYLFCVIKSLLYLLLWLFRMQNAILVISYVKVV